MREKLLVESFVKQMLYTFFMLLYLMIFQSCAYNVNYIFILL